LKLKWERGTREGGAVEGGEEAGEGLVTLVIADEDGDLECFFAAVDFMRKLQGGAHVGMESMFLGRLVGTGGAVEAHVIREGEGAVTKFCCALDEVFGRTRASEEGEAGTRVEFGEHGEEF
jgi:hypothetical protein